MNYSTAGRPRELTNAQVTAIRAWHKSRQTLADIAKQYGVSRSVVVKILGGYNYKQMDPELR